MWRLRDKTPRKPPNTRAELARYEYHQAVFTGAICTVDGFACAHPHKCMILLFLTDLLMVLRLQKKIMMGACLLVLLIVIGGSLLGTFGGWRRQYPICSHRCDAFLACLLPKLCRHGLTRFDKFHAEMTHALSRIVPRFPSSPRTYYDNRFLPWSSRSMDHCTNVALPTKSLLQLVVEGSWQK